MHPQRSRRRPLVLMLALAAGLSTTMAVAQPPADGQPKVEPSAAKVDKNGNVIVPLGGIVAFKPDLPKDKDGKTVFPTEFDNSREDVLKARFSPTDPTTLFLSGSLPGYAQLTLRFPIDPGTGRPYASRRIDVIVQPDYELLRRLIRQTEPTANIEVNAGLGNVVILSGYVTSPQDADIVSRLANSAVGGSPTNVINAIQVGGVQQVQIDVVF